MTNCTNFSRFPPSVTLRWPTTHMPCCFQNSIICIENSVVCTKQFSIPPIDHIIFQCWMKIRGAENVIFKFTPLNFELGAHDCKISGTCFLSWKAKQSPKLHEKWPNGSTLINFGKFLYKDKMLLKTCLHVTSTTSLSSSKHNGGQW